jgi:hypothetical protein
MRVERRTLHIFFFLPHSPTIKALLVDKPQKEVVQNSSKKPKTKNPEGQSFPQYAINVLIISAGIHSGYMQLINDIMQPFNE